MQSESWTELSVYLRLDLSFERLTSNVEMMSRLKIEKQEEYWELMSLLKLKEVELKWVGCGDWSGYMLDWRGELWVLGAND